jgi:hypothetical protein
MLHSTVIDVAIGLVFVYLILGLVCTTVNEWFAQCFKARAATLAQGIHGLLSGALARVTPVTAADVKIKATDLNLPKLIQRLRAPGEKLASALGLDPNNLPGNDELASKLDKLLDNASLATQIDTSNVTPQTLAAVKKISGNPRLANLNLLSEAYPDEIGGLLHSFYSHPLIKSLSKPGGHPSYVPAGAFVTVVMDILGSGSANVTFDSIRQAIADLPESDAKRSIMTLANAAGNDLGKLQRSLETWFDNTMDRVSGWYKTKTQIVTVVVAAGITIFANADTVLAARKLFVSPTIRDTLVAEAGAATKSKELPALTNKQRDEIGELTGWSADFTTFNRMKAEAEHKPNPASDAFPGLQLFTSTVFFSWVWAIVPVHLLGWVLTTIAVSLGAPFWFDTLNKFMNIRAAGTAPNEKKNDLSKA